MGKRNEKSQRFDVLGVELEWRLRSGDTAGQYCVLTATVPPGVGIPPHRHPDHEAFFVLEGGPEFAVEDADGFVWRSVEPGEMVNIPCDAMHGFRNASGREAKVLITCAPGLGAFFEEAGTPLADHESGTDLLPEAIQRVLAIAHKHGQRFAAPA